MTGVDPLRTSKIGPMNRREAPESGLESVGRARTDRFGKAAPSDARDGPDLQRRPCRPRAF